jgi:TetR/AcrR family transcriptional repressor of nem operon
MARASVKQQIIEAGLAELHARGYTACSVEDIKKAAGVPKGSFYNHFTSKEDFAVEVVRRYFQVTRVSDWPASSGPTPAIARLRAGFDALEAQVRHRAYSRGCMWGNLANEVADSSAAIRSEVAEGLDAWSAVVTELIAEAQRNGEISSGGDASRLGRFVVDAWEGALTRCRVVRTRQPTDDFFEMIFGFLLA